MCEVAMAINCKAICTQAINYKEVALLSVIWQHSMKRASLESSADVTQAHSELNKKNRNQNLRSRDMGVIKAVATS